MTQPGWYADPSGAAATLRYWDGGVWTEQTRPVPAETGGEALPRVAATHQAASMPNSARRANAALAQRCQPLVAPGETVGWAWMGRKGIGSSRLVLLLWVTQLLLFLQKFFVVAVTERQIYVFKAGWFVRNKPRSVAFTLPRSSALGPMSGGRFPLGDERVRVDRYQVPIIEAAASGVPVPPPDTR